jgi:1-acyl-sn-glycerol-3-phosphate acyltransferase
VIPANKNPMLDWALFQALKIMLRQSFHDIRIRGREHLAALSPQRPAIAFSNHTNWWDGLLVFYLTRELPAKNFYCMMEEKQLRHYRFFTWLGAFSVDLDNPLRAAGAVRYAMRLLAKPSTLLWIFPQGALVSPYRRIEAQPGVHFLAARANGAQLLPAAFRYEFFRQNKPQVLIEVGQPIAAHQSSQERIAEACNQVAERLDAAVKEANLEGFQVIMKATLPINKKWEWWTRALTGRLAGFQPEN